MNIKSIEILDSPPKGPGHSATNLKLNENGSPDKSKSVTP